MSSQATQQGITTIGVMIVIFFSALTIALAIQFIGIGELLGGYSEQRSERSFELADSCAAESLLRLRRDSGYTGGTLVVGPDSCTITVTGGGATRTIDITSTSQTFTRKLQLEVTLSGSSVTVDSWEEVTT